ncbi:hypothetical protein [Kribbella sp. NPDC051620]|uniref:hypothetical protein n=1 Tax=Kribbella sp. NPDC051620 TaxID=3364120 RepID=UPI0037AF1354
MNADLLSGLLGSAVTLAGGVGGVLLTGWFDNRKTNVAHDRERRSAQRAHAVEIVDAGRDWCTGLQVAAVILASGTSTADVLELDEWKEHLTSTTRYRRALRAADLVFDEDRVRAASNKLATHLADQHIPMKALTTKHIAGQRSVRADVERVNGFADIHQQMLDEFVTVARDSLR